MNYDLQTLKNLYSKNPILEENKEFLEYLLSFTPNASKSQASVNLPLLIKDIVYTLNIPENNNGLKPLYASKSLIIREEQLEPLMNSFIETTTKNSINMRKSVFQIDKAILNYRISKNFKATPKEISAYIQTLLKEDVDTTFLYSPKPYQRFDWDYETAEIINEANIFSADITNDLNKKLYASKNHSYIAIGNYLPYSFINYDVNNMYASWSGLKTLINTQHNPDIKNLIFLSRSNQFNALKNYLDADKQNPDNNKLTPNLLEMKNKLLSNGIYLSAISKEEFKNKVKDILGIDENTLKQMLSYADNNLIYSPNAKEIEFISSLELKDWDKKLMFQLGITPSASSLTKLILGNSTQTHKLSIKDVVKKINDLTFDKDKMQQLVIQRVEEKANLDVVSKLELKDFKSKKELEEYLISNGYTLPLRNDANKYLSYGTYSEDKTIKHFNYLKDRPYIASEKRTMNIAKIFDIPFLTMNFDGMELALDENNNRVINNIIEVKSTIKNLELADKEELQANFLNSYYLQTALYANVIQPKEGVEVLYHINNKDASIKYKSFKIDINKLKDTDLIPALKNFYKEWLNTLNKAKPMLVNELKAIDKQIELVKPLLTDTKFKEFISNANTDKLFNLNEEELEEPEID